MNKRILCLSLAFVFAFGFSVYAEREASGVLGGGGGAMPEQRFYYEPKLEDVTDSYNIEQYTVLPEEKEEMYDADVIFRRNYETGLAWFIYEIPYLHKFSAELLHFPEDIEDITFEVSKDGENWTAVDVATSTYESEGHWTQIIYESDYFEETRYLKVIWGEACETNHWWTPYYISTRGCIGKPYPAGIVFEDEPEIAIPAYDSRKYKLSAKVIDNIGLDYPADITYSIVSADDERISVSEDGEIEIFSDMKDGDTFTVRAEYGILLEEEKTFTLCAAFPGDYDEDGIITDIDIEAIKDNFGKKATMENRLCDADKNGIIDILDLAYAARYKTDLALREQ